VPRVVPAGWLGVPLCWCESLDERIPYFVSNREECKRLEQYIKKKASAPEFIVCYYED
jgi:hypothetical protein